MKTLFFLFFSVFVVLISVAQKKIIEIAELNHWEKIENVQLSDKGEWVSYKINKQEGDFIGVIYNLKNKNSFSFPRLADIKFSKSENFIIGSIHQFFDSTKRKKKRSENLGDSLALINLDKQHKIIFANVKKYNVSSSIQFPEFLIFLQNHPNHLKQNISDSLAYITMMNHYIDSFQTILSQLKTNSFKEFEKKINSSILQSQNSINSTLFIYNLQTNKLDSLKEVKDFYFDEENNALFALIKNNRNYILKLFLLHDNNFNSNSFILDSNINQYRQAVIKRDELDSTVINLAFLSTTDTIQDDLKAIYNLHFYSISNKQILKNHQTITASEINVNYPNMLISPFKNILISKTGEKCFFGLKFKPIPNEPVKNDEIVHIDIWHYNDEYLQPEQIKNLSKSQKQSFLTLFMPRIDKILLLQDTHSNLDIDLVSGDENFYYYSIGKKIINHQWEGFVRYDDYVVDLINLNTKKIAEDSRRGVFEASPNGNWLIYMNILEQIPNYKIYSASENKWTPLNNNMNGLDEDNDIPDNPQSYGIFSWLNNDSIILYDKYDFWLLAITNNKFDFVKVSNGRKHNWVYRLNSIKNSNNSRVKYSSKILGTRFNKMTKKWGVFLWDRKTGLISKLMDTSMGIYSDISYNLNTQFSVFTLENFNNSPNLYTLNLQSQNLEKITNINTQQKNYLWGNVNLEYWKTFKGKSSEGLLYIPENIDTSKSYPMIVYFYELNSDNLYKYNEPAPTPSRLNYALMVNRGYVVFVPDIHYTIGQPGPSAYDYVISGVTNLLKKYKWLDNKNIAVQGQSWGGYQIAYLITKTSIFKCAWAGAPVVNMFSAYGGIRWNTGLNRQFQYEKTQSRIGGTIWDKKDLYIKNSPLFDLPKVNTPIVIMHNDKDGAVPWYQGIEMFTALRRLNKKVWLLNYNGEDHNLVERKNKIDITKRQIQFFDYYLKGLGKPKWLLQGVPALLKGKDFGFEDIR